MAKKWLVRMAVGLLFWYFPTLGFSEHCASEKDCQEYLIKFSNHASEQEIDRVLDKSSLSAVEYFPSSRILHVMSEGPQSAKQTLENLNEEAHVMYAEPNYPIQMDRTPNDPYYSSLWGLHNIGQSSGTVGADIGMEQAWDLLTSSSKMVVAVIDTGIDYTHPDLKQNMWVNSKEVPNNGKDDDGNGYIDDYYGYNFYASKGDPMDDNYHGTHVAGTIGAVGDNGVGVVGVNWNVQLMAIKFLSSDGGGYLSDAIKAIDYAVKNGAKVLNNSWGFSAGLSGLPSNPKDEPVQSLRDAIQAADTEGVVFVASAGNNGTNADSSPSYPAAYSVKNIISVASTDRNDKLSSFSNYGKISVDLGAPGSSIYSTIPTRYSTPYGTLSGTSMSSPHVTGAAAMVWANNSALSHREVIDHLLQGVDSNSDLSGKSVTGGRLNVYKSLLLDQANHAPVASAGPDQYMALGELVTLSGSATDKDGDTSFTYAWTLTLPSGSSATLNSSSSSQVSFMPDIVGTYYATLMVSDGELTSTPATAMIKVSEKGVQGPPTVVIKVEQGGSEVGGSATTVSTGESIKLDGSGTTVQMEETIDYQWAFITKPAGSQASITDAQSAVAYFTPDAAGTYTVSLGATIGKYSSTAEVSFTAQSASTDSAGTSSGGCALASASTPSSPLVSFIFLVIPLGLFFLQKKQLIQKNNMRQPFKMRISAQDG